MCRVLQGLVQTLSQNRQLDRALEVLARMHTVPSPNIYLSLLKECNKSLALDQAKQVYAHLTLHQAPLTGFLGDYLVMTLAKCGAIEDALYTSHTLPCRTVFSWTAIISAYADRCCGREALKMHQYMIEDGVEPDLYTFVSLFKACGSIPDLQQGKKLHAEAARLKGFASDVVIGNTLVSMYGKCGALVEAEHVFSALHICDVVSWNAMLSAYVEQGQGPKALQLYLQMQQEGVSANQLSSMIALQACATLAQREESVLVEWQSTNSLPLEIGQALHANSHRKGFTHDVFVGNTLVSMYGKCGAIVEAEHVFVALPHRDVVSWNTMLSAYVEYGQVVKALQLYSHMLDIGASPDQSTLLIAIQACATLANLEEALLGEGGSTEVMPLEIGQALHADSYKKGFASSVFLGSTLVSMYGKCGAILEAEHVFAALSHRDVVSWNAMLSAYIEQGQGQKALQLYTQMQEEGTSPDQLSSVIALQACATIEEKEDSFVEGRSTKVMPMIIGQALHADARRRDFTSDVFVGNTLVSLYGKCRAIVEAEHVFSAISQRTLVSWNAMLSAYVEHSQGKKALQLYVHMQEEGVCPDQLTFLIVLQACAILTENEEAFFVEEQSAMVMPREIGQALHVDACRKGFASDVLVGNALVSIYSKCGATLEAKHVFRALSQHNVASWNAMLSAYVEQGQEEKALQLYRQMRRQCVPPDHATFVFTLQACSETGTVEVCEQLHFDVVSAGYELIPSLAATLIHAYGRCANMANAHAFFDVLSEPDIVAWNTCIAGHAVEGNHIASLHMFENLKLAGAEPNEVTFISVLSACCRSGLVVRGTECFECMSRDYDITPDLKHYGNMLDLLGRVGDFKRVENVLDRMPIQADLTIWLCLLGACGSHGNAELAKQVFDHAVNLQPKQASAYVVMSNLYAAGLWDPLVNRCKLWSLIGPFSKRTSMGAVVSTPTKIALKCELLAMDYLLEQHL